MSRWRRATSLVLSTMAGAAFMAGCSSGQWYASGQSWQRDACNRLQDVAERTRCERSAATSYEDYRKQAEAARQTPPTPPQLQPQPLP